MRTRFKIGTFFPTEHFDGQLNACEINGTGSAHVQELKYAAPLKREIVRYLLEECKCSLKNDNVKHTLNHPVCNGNTSSVKSFYRPGGRKFKNLYDTDLSSKKNSFCLLEFCYGQVSLYKGQSLRT
jgi:hypothetical protein